MIVCLCKGVSDSEIQSHVGDGAMTVREVGRRCGAGTRCGMCRCDIRDMVRRSSRRGDSMESPTQVLSK